MSIHVIDGRPAIQPLSWELDDAQCLYCKRRTNVNNEDSVEAPTPQGGKAPFHQVCYFLDKIDKLEALVTLLGKAATQSGEPVKPTQERKHVHTFVGRNCVDCGMGLPGLDVPPMRRVVEQATIDRCDVLVWMPEDGEVAKTTEGDFGAAHDCGGFALVRFKNEWTLRDYYAEGRLVFCPTCGKRLPLEA